MRSSGFPLPPSLFSLLKYFPRLFETRNVQVGYRETDQTRLGFGAGTGRAFVAYLAAGARRSARKRRDGGRVVVRLHFHQGVRKFAAEAVAAAGARIEALDLRAFDDGGVIGVCDHSALGVQLVRVADHAEQGDGLLLAVDDPVGVEYLVAAVFGVGLREHHQLDIGGVASQPGEVLHQIIDLVGGKGQTQFAVGGFQCGLAAFEDIHRGERLRRAVLEYLVFDACPELSRRAGNVGNHGFCHAVVQQRQHGLFFGIRQRLAALGLQVKQHAALDARDLRQGAMARDVGGFGRPGRDGAQARHDQQARYLALEMGFACTLVQTEQTIQQDGVGRGKFGGKFGEVAVAGVFEGDARFRGAQRGAQFVETEGGKSGFTYRSAEHGMDKGR